MEDWNKLNGPEKAALLRQWSQTGHFPSFSDHPQPATIVGYVLTPHGPLPWEASDGPPPKDMLFVSYRHNHSGGSAPPASPSAPGRGIVGRTKRVVGEAGPDIVKAARPGVLSDDDVKIRDFFRPSPDDYAVEHSFFGIGPADLILGKEGGGSHEK
jgi:hypothetical protein